MRTLMSSFNRSTTNTSPSLLMITSSPVRTNPSGKNVSLVLRVQFSSDKRRGKTSTRHKFPNHDCDPTGRIEWTHACALFEYPRVH